MCFGQERDFNVEYIYWLTRVIYENRGEGDKQYFKG